MLTKVQEARLESCKPTLATICRNCNITGTCTPYSDTIDATKPCSAMLIVSAVVAMTEQGMQLVDEEVTAQFG